MSWAAYYDYNAIGDVLLLVFDMKGKTNKTIKKGDIVALYHDDTLIGINIFHFSDIVKMHTHGRIFLLPLPIIKVINDKLVNAGFEPLELLDKSGFYVGKFLYNTERGALISLGDKEVIVDSKIEKDSPQYVVLASKDAILFNGEMVKNKTDADYYLCHYVDLGLIGYDIIFLNEEEKAVGKDYFA